MDIKQLTNKFFCKTGIGRSEFARLLETSPSAICSLKNRNRNKLLFKLMLEIFDRDFSDLIDNEDAEKDKKSMGHGFLNYLKDLLG
jgi:hypothetical protein